MPVHKIRWIILLILPLVLVACGGGSDELSAEELARLPTIAPSNTATSTPSDTPVPSRTPLPTNTPIPTSTPITPTATRTPSPTPTSTGTPLPSSTPAPTITLTFTPFPTSGPQVATMPPSDVPRIVSFGADATSVPGGTGVTLSWQAQGASALIDQLDSAYNSVNTFDVPTSGQITVQVPDQGPQVTYQLVVTGLSGQEALQTLTIQVQSVCQTPWFFANPPDDAGCPTGPETVITGKSQQFQQGYMINLTLNGQDLVYGFNSVDNRYVAYNNQWDGTSTYSDASCGSPGFGAQEPQDVFNWAFYNTLGTFGQWCNLETGIGWATLPFNANISFRVQLSDEGTTFFIDIPNYGIVRVSGEMPLGSWRRLP